MTIDPTTWAYRDGWRAAIAGQSRDSNPCHPVSEAARSFQWFCGFDANKPVTLWREIDALGGSVEDDYDRGHSMALRGVLDLLEKRGHSEFVDPQADLLAALKPFAAMLDALELQTTCTKSGVWYAAESSAVGLRELTIEQFQAARAAIAKANASLRPGSGEV